jgi:DNA polymerase-4
LTVTELASELAHAAVADSRQRRISLLGVSVSNLVAEPAQQLELPLGLVTDPRRPGTPSGAARWQIDRSVDAVRARFGREAVGYAAVTLSREARVPDAFRELAERG